MSGEKGTHRGAMLIPGYGTMYLHVAEVGYGVNIIASETESRYGKSIYITAKTAGSFNMTISHFSYEAYFEFSRVMLHYGNNLARGIVGSPCRVMIPSIKDAKGKGFDRVGIPRNGMPFGDNVATVAYKTTLDFFGTTDPYSPLGVKDVTKVSNVIGSEYAAAIKKDPQAAYYYPIGTQLSGSNYGADTLYDSVPGDSAVFEEPAESAEDTAAGVDPRNRSDGTPIGGL